VACQQAADNRTEFDLSAIESQLKKFEETLLAPDVPIETVLQEYLGYFVDDPVLLPPDESAVQGYDAALAYYTEGFAGGTVVAVDYHLQEPEIFLNGDMAIRRYIGSSEIKWDGELEHYSSYNRYIDILQRQADGEWRVVWHAWHPIDK
jgi:ketosteroid isomerase-like protein